MPKAAASPTAAVRSLPSLSLKAPVSILKRAAPAVKPLPEREQAVHTSHNRIGPAAAAAEALPDAPTAPPSFWKRPFSVQRHSQPLPALDMPHAVKSLRRFPFMQQQEAEAAGDTSPERSSSDVDGSGLGSHLGSGSCSPVGAHLTARRVSVRIVAPNPKSAVLSSSGASVRGLDLSSPWLKSSPDEGARAGRCEEDMDPGRSPSHGSVRRGNQEESAPKSALSSSRQRAGSPMLETLNRELRQPRVVSFTAEAVVDLVAGERRHASSFTPGAHRRGAAVRGSGRTSLAADADEDETASSSRVADAVHKRVASAAEPSKSFKALRWSLEGPVAQIGPAAQQRLRMGVENAPQSFVRHPFPRKNTGGSSPGRPSYVSSARSTQRQLPSSLWHKAAAVTMANSRLQAKQRGGILPAIPAFGKQLSPDEQIAFVLSVLREKGALKTFQESLALSASENAEIDRESAADAAAAADLTAKRALLRSQVEACCQQAIQMKSELQVCGAWSSLIGFACLLCARLRCRS